MKQNYSIEEILSAVNKIHDKRKDKKIKITKNISVQEDYSTVPKNTLRLIEEAEKIKS
tara:strand:- start:448 stop:621 length:174 start_codon:yes stop_codon:yes gene_type:complete